MRKCCIQDCASCELNKERNLFEINDARKEWINIIKKNQTLNENRRLYICDLHFNFESIKKHNSKTILQKNAVPIFEKFDDVGEEVSEEVEFGSDNICDEVSEDVELEIQLKTISLAEYRELKRTNLQVKKLQNVIAEMSKIIESKDSQLEVLYEAYQRAQNKSINISNLSAEQKEVVICLVNGNNGLYTENVRKFAMKQQYYSTAAYKSLRIFFNKNLPAMRTLQLWYTSVDGCPGISESSLNIIREKAELFMANNNFPLHLALLCDEMAIRKELCYCNQAQSFIGFSTITNLSQHNEDTSELKLAKEALVFMVAGPDFKLAVAYELLNGLEGEYRAALTLQVVKCIEEAGAVVMSLTSDALPANITTAEELGAKFDENKPYFFSPSYPKNKIFIILDPSHMLKLIRKHLSSNKIYYQNQLVDWELLEKLVKKQSSDNFNLCNKLTKQHIEWNQKPMNVRLAAETISKSVADTLEQLLKDGYEEFENAKPLIEYLLFFNNAFDILNFGENRRADGRYKQKLCEETANHIFEFAERFKRYLSQLKLQTGKNKVHILSSSVEKGFFGFYIDFISLQGIYEDFILDGPLDEFYTFQFSQDHLETYFSLIRNSLGRNDNPNAIEFKSAFKKLLVCHPVMTSVDHNVISNATGILTVSSKRKKKSLTSTVQEKALELELELCYEEIMIEEITMMDLYEQHMCAYLALCIEENFFENVKQHKYKCTQCAYVVFTANDIINDELLAMKNTERKQPSGSTFKIVIFANAVMKMYSAERYQGNSFNVVLKTIRENLNIDDVFSEFYLLTHEINGESTTISHKEEFISELIKIYMTMKSKSISKKITVEERGELLRFRKKRDYLLAGQ